MTWILQLKPLCVISNVISANSLEPHSPFMSIDALTGSSRCDGTHDCSQDAGHGVQVMNATCVLNLQVLLHEGLHGKNRYKSICSQMAYDAQRHLLFCQTHSDHQVAECGDYPADEAHDERTIRWDHKFSRCSHGDSPARVAFWICTWVAQSMLQI